MTRQDKQANQTTTQPHTPDLPDSEFFQQITTNIADELANEEVSIFKDALATELNKTLKKLNKTVISDPKPYVLAEGLIKVLVQGTKDVPVIKLLTNVCMQCFDKRKGKLYEKSKPQHEAIKETIEQLLGWLVLASIDDSQLLDWSPKAGYGKGVYFELPVRTQGGVEVIVSRQHQRQSNLQPAEAEMQGCHAMLVTGDTLSWKQESAVDDLKLMLWNKIFPERDQDTYLTSDQIEDLNVELQTRRDDDWDTEHHYLVIKNGEFDDKGSYEGTYKQLLIELDQLTIVRFGAYTDDQSHFCLYERNLMSAIYRLLTNINKALSHDYSTA